ncbi:D-alanine--D-alanine ligase [Aspergillus ambiguus]|uniref:D-alanine--D-alanine ligase family protein n=1 Tax=Aspergillus ambiguus TaxID=176160 RepID=UPI003CCD38D4
MPLRIALVYELRSAYKAIGYTDADCLRLCVGRAADRIASSLRQHGHHVLLIPDLRSFVRWLASDGEHQDIVFNITEGLHGMAREAQVPALLEAYQIPFTFSDAATMALCLDKARTKMILEHYGVPTAPFAVIHSHQGKSMLSSERDLLEGSHHERTLDYPLFVKPLAEGSSSGITGMNKVHNASELRDVIAKIYASAPTSQDILVEKFLSGREFTIAVMGTGERSWVLGADEFVWRDDQHVAKVDGMTGDMDVLMPFMTRNCKVDVALGDKQRVEQVAANESQPAVQRACEVGLEAWRVLGCRDCGRVDVRLDGNDAYVLEINPLAGLHPETSELPMIAQHKGVAYEDLMEMIVHSAMERYTPVRLSN